MTRFQNPLLSLAAPSLILIGLLGLLQREGSDRLQLLPALIVGFVLILSGALGRRTRRKRLLIALRMKNQEPN